MKEMKTKVIFETRQLRLEEAVAGDAEFFFTLLNSPTWLQYIGDRGIETREDAESYIQKSLIESYSKNGYGLWKMVLKEDNRPVGICGFLNRDYLDHPDIGFAILPDFEGRGLTSEAVERSLEYGRKELGMDTILAITIEENTRSRRLLEKAGFRLVKKFQPEAEELLLYSNP